MRNHSGRWLIAIMGTVLMLCLGTVYAWSFFQDLLVRQYHDLYGWSNSQVAWVFSLAIFFLGSRRHGEGSRCRRSARAGWPCWAGFCSARVCRRRPRPPIGSLALLYLGYGVLGGIGLGLGYVTPVATVAKWFPDRKGLATGMVIMGFGLGALLMSKVLAPLLLGWTSSLVSSFLVLGAVFFLFTVGPAAFMRNPREGLEARGVGARERGEGRGIERGRHRETGAPAGVRPHRARRRLLGPVRCSCGLSSSAISRPGSRSSGSSRPLLQSLWKKADPSLSARRRGIRRDPHRRELAVQRRGQVLLGRGLRQDRAGCGPSGIMLGTRSSSSSASCSREARGCSRCWCAGSCSATAAASGPCRLS